MNENYKIYLAKYIVNEISDDEIFELRQWLNEDEKNYAEFKDYVEINYGVGFLKDLGDLNLSFNKDILPSIKKTKRVNFLRYAAVFVGIALLSSILILSNIFDSSNQNQLLAANQSKVILSNDSGGSQIIDTNKEKQLVDAKGGVLGAQIGKEIVYNQLEEEEEKPLLVQNTLSVPYGESFKVTFNDGSQIYLNAGSSIKYPSYFEEGKPREVTLNGEGYFIIAKDEKRPFFVHTDKMKIKVLGTQFNLSAYKNDIETSVVLVEGSTAIFNKNTKKSIKIQPNQKATIYSNKKLKGRTIVKNVSVHKYISWKTGEMIFENEPFFSILMKAERHYNVKIENTYDDISYKRFTGKFKQESISEFLEVFKAHTSFKFKYVDNKIIIKK